MEWQEMLQWIAVGGLAVFAGEVGARLTLGALAAWTYARRIKEQADANGLTDELTALFEKNFTSAEGEDVGGS